MAKRINVILQDETIKTVERSAKPGEHSRFIDRAVRYYAAMHSSATLHERLRSAALRDRDLAEEIAHDWFAVDNETWQPRGRNAPGNRSTRNAEKSTS